MTLGDPGVPLLPPAEDPHLIQQVSLGVDSLDDLRAFHRRLVAEGYRIEGIVNHATSPTTSCWPRSTACGIGSVTCRSAAA